MCDTRLIYTAKKTFWKPSFFFFWLPFTQMEKSIKKKLLCLLILVLFFVISEHARLVAAMHVIARNSPMFTTAKNAEIFAGISTKYTPVFSWKCEKIDDFYFSVNAATVGMGRRYVPCCPAPPFFRGGGEAEFAFHQQKRTVPHPSISNHLRHTSSLLVSIIHASMQHN